MKVLEITSSKDEEGQAVIVSKKNDTKGGAANQKWKVIYTDKAKPLRTKGFNK